MIFLSKQAICVRLAKSLLPRQPFLELRKLRINETVSEMARNALLYYYHKAEKPHEYFDPPRPYLNHPALPEFDHSIDKLSESDRELLDGITPLDGLILESADSFNGYYQKFMGSDKKPDWDLVRVLVSDTLENYQNRHKEYERLLNGGLNAWINRGDVLKLDEDEYQFKPENPITDTAILSDRIIYFHAALYQSIGESLAAYNTRQHNPTRSEPETKKFALQINAMIDKALHSGELPVYRRPAYLRVEYAAYPVNTDDVIRWNDLKALLESKTGQGLPEYPVFMSWWPEIESAMEAQGQSGEPETKAMADGKADLSIDGDAMQAVTVERNGKPPRMKLIPKLRDANEGLLLVYEIVEKYKIQYLDELPGAAAWGKIVSKNLFNISYKRLE